MKKIIAITAMAAAVAGFSFADEPTADVKVAEVSGNASVTWGVDLDDTAAGTFSSGFKNEAEATFKVNLANKGSKSTEGDGIWGEVGVEVTQDLKTKSTATATGGEGAGTGWDGDNLGKIKVSGAKLHFGPVYVGIMSGDTKVGDFKVPNAIMSADNDNALKIAGVGATAEHGIVGGYGDDNFGFDVDLRTTPAPLTAAVAGTKYYEVLNTTTNDIAWEVADAEGTSTNVTKGKANDGYMIMYTWVKGAAAAGAMDYYNNGYAMAVEAKLKDSNSFVPGLAVNVGFAMPFANNPTLSVGANASYKLPIGETFYLKPSVAYTLTATTGTGATATNQLVGGVLFGWGDTADANAGVPYLDGDYAKKVTPGVGAALQVSGLGTSSVGVTIVPSFYSGDLIPNLKAGAVAELGIVGSTFNFGIAGGAKYTIAVGDSIKVSPYGGVRFINGGATTAVFKNANADNGGRKDLEGTANKLNIKAGCEFTGLISNTTFDVWYQSRNLADTTTGSLNKAGTINLKCKIAL